MRSDTAIANAIDSIKSAVLALDNLKPRDNSMAAHQEMEQHANVHKMAIIGGALELIGGAFADINRVANALETIAKGADNSLFKNLADQGASGSLTVHSFGDQKSE